MNNHPLQQYISELNNNIKKLNNEMKQLEKTKLEYYKIMFSDIFNNELDNIIKEKYKICLINDLKYIIDENKHEIKFDVSGITFKTFPADNFPYIFDYVETIYDDISYNINYFKECYLLPYSDKYMNQECYILHSITKKSYFIIDKIQYDKMINDIKLY